MATNATCLFTLAQVRTWVGITDAGDVSQDATLEYIANGVTAYLERATLRKFVTRSITEVRDGDGSRKLFLNNFPVTAFTSLSIRRSPTDTDLELLPSDAYRCRLDIGVVDVHSDILSHGVGNVSAVYSCGFAAQGAAGLPQDIFRAGLDLVKLIYDEKQHNAVSASAINIGGMNFQLKPSWPAHIQRTIDDWRRVM